jgi:hypothetical protein
MMHGVKDFSFVKTEWDRLERIFMMGQVLQRDREGGSEFGAKDGDRFGRSRQDYS